MSASNADIQQSVSHILEVRVVNAMITGIWWLIPVFGWCHCSKKWVP